MPPLASSFGLRRLARLLVVGVVALAVACVDGSTPLVEGGDEGPTVRTQVALSPVYRGSPAAQAAARAINRIRITAFQAGNATPLTGFPLDTIVDPNPPGGRWSLMVPIDVPQTGGIQVDIVIELLHEAADGTLTVEWSGRVQGLSVTAGGGGGTTPSTIDVVRGPPDNLSVTGISLPGVLQTVEEESTFPLAAQVSTSEAGVQPVVGWRSLEPDVASVDGEGNVTGLLPGTARIVAEAGIFADTANVRVIARPTAVAVTPEAQTVPIGEEAAFEAVVVDRRGEPVPGQPVVWSVVDEAGLDDLGGGRFLVTASGRHRVRATSVNRPDLSGEGEVVVPVEPADLSVTKTADRTSAEEGETVTYRVVARNNGPGAMPAVRAVDQWSEGLAFVAASSERGQVTTSTDRLVWEIGLLAVGDSAVLEVQLRVAPGSGGRSLENSVTVSGDALVTDPNPGNDRATAVLSAQVPPADLSVTKRAIRSSAATADTASFVVVVRNDGPGRASGIVVRDSAGVGLRLEAGTVDRGSFSFASGLWNVGTLVAGDSAVLTVRGRVGVDGTVGQVVTNTAFVAERVEPDPNPGNDRAQASISVGQVTAELAITKTALDPSVALGDTAAFRVVLTNRGPSSALGVVVTDTLPAGLVLVRTSSTGGSFDAATGRWSLDRIDAGEADTLVVVGRVDEGVVQAGAELRNRVRVLTSQARRDSISRNDTASAAITARKGAVDLALTKVAARSGVVEGDTVTFAVVVRNASGRLAQQVSVRDSLGAGAAIDQVTQTRGAFDGQTGIWTVGDLAPGAQDTLWVRVRTLPGSAGQNVGNTAWLLALPFQTDSVPGNDRQRAGVDVASQGIDLAVAKTVDNPTPDVGGLVTFTVTVTNTDATREATGVTVTDVLPTGLSLASTPPSGYDDQSGLWTVGSLPAGGSASLSLEVLVDPGTAGQTLTNVAALASSVPTDTNAANDTAQAALTARRDTVDISITKQAARSGVVEGDTVTFVVVVSNVSGPAAQGVSVRDSLGAGAAIDLVTQTRGTFDAQTGVWTVGDLAPGAQDTLWVRVRALPGSAGQNVGNTAWVLPLALQTDTVPGNDRQRAGVDVGARSADIAVRKDVDTADPLPSDTVTFTVVARNLGPQAVTAVGVQETLPTGLTYVSHGGGGSYDTQASRWTTPALAVGDSAILTLRAEVAAGTTGQTLTNRIEVVDRQGVDVDPVATNDTASVAVNPRGIDLAVAKTVDNPTPDVGGLVTFTVTVTNTDANLAATGVTVTDVLPTGLSLASTPPPGYDDQTGIWTVGSLPASGTATLELEVLVDSGTTGQTLTNVAALASSVPIDTNAANDTAQAAVTVANQPPQYNGVTTASTGDETPVDLALAGFDPDGDDLTWTVTGLPAAGTVSPTNAIGTSPTITYTPAQGNLGPQTITVQIADGRGGTDIGIITVDVVDEPQNLVYQTAGNTTLVTSGWPTPVEIHLLTNEGLLVGTPSLVLTPAVVATNLGGTVEFDASGEFRYVPPAGQTGVTDSFEYTPVGSTTSGTVEIEISEQYWYVDNMLGSLPAPGQPGGPAQQPPAPNGTSAAPFTSINDAIAAAAPGEPIYVRTGGGPYDEEVVLLENLDLLGEGAALQSGTFGELNPAGARPVLTSASGVAVQGANGVYVAGLDIDAPEAAGFLISGTSTPVSLEDVRITGGSGGIELNLVTGEFTATNVEIDNPTGATPCIDTRDNAFGVYGGSPTVDVTLGANGIDNGVCAAVRIEDTTGGLVNIGGGVIFESTGNGVSIENNGAPVTINSTVQVARSAPAGAPGIQTFAPAADVTFANVDITTIGDEGIGALAGTGRVTIQAGTVYTTDNEAIQANGPFTATLASATAVNATNGDGIRITSNGGLPVTIDRVDIEIGHGGTGLFLQDVGSFTVTDNTSRIIADDATTPGTGSRAVSATTTALNAIFGVITSSNFSGDPFLFEDVTGALTVTELSVEGQTGTGISITGGSAAYDLTLVSTGVTNTEGRSIYVEGLTGGSLVLQGGTLTDNGNGIHLIGNTGSSISLENTFVIDGTGFVDPTDGVLPLFYFTGDGSGAPSAGTLEVTGTGNQVSGSDTDLVYLESGTLGPSGVQFERVDYSWNGSATNSFGVVIGNMVEGAAHGPFSILGSGGAGSGGTLDGVQGNAVQIIGIRDVTLRDMELINSQARSLFLTPASGTTVLDGIVSVGNGRAANVQSNSGVVDVTVVNSTFSGSYTPTPGAPNVQWGGLGLNTFENGGAQGSMTARVENSTFADNTFIGLGLRTLPGGGDLTVELVDNTFERNLTSGFRASAESGALLSITTLGTNTVSGGFTPTSEMISNGDDAEYAPQDQGIELLATQVGRLDASVEGVTVSNPDRDGVYVVAADAGEIVYRSNGSNTVTGSRNGYFVATEGSGVVRADIRNQSVIAPSQDGILLLSAAGHTSGGIEARIIDNTVEFAGGHSYATRFDGTGTHRVVLQGNQAFDPNDTPVRLYAGLVAGSAPVVDYFVMANDVAAPAGFQAPNIWGSFGQGSDVCVDMGANIAPPLVEEAGIYLQADGTNDVSVARWDELLLSDFLEFLDGLNPDAESTNFDENGAFFVGVEDCTLPGPAPLGNTLPVALPYAELSTDNATPVAVPLEGFDADGGALSFSIAAQPSVGAVAAPSVLDANSNSAVFTPGAGDIGQRSFTHEVTDGTSTSQAVLNVDVTSSVTAQPVAFTVPGQTELVAGFAAPSTVHKSEAEGMLPAASPLTVTGLSGVVGCTGNTCTTGANGTVVWQADGGFSYKPNVNFTGVDSFNYDTDAGGTAQVEITVGPSLVNYVDGDAAGPGSGTSWDPWTTLADAQMFSSSGTFIYLAAAASPYVSPTFNLKLNQSLIGSGADLNVDGALLASAGTRPIVSPPGPGAGLVLASGATVQGVDLTAQGGNPFGSGLAAVEISGSTISDMTITGQAGAALYVAFSAGSFFLDDVDFTSTEPNAMGLQVQGGTPDVNWSGSGALGDAYALLESDGSSAGTVQMRRGPWTASGDSIIRVSGSGANVRVDSVTADMVGVALAVLSSTGTITVNEFDVNAGGSGIAVIGGSPTVDVTLSPTSMTLGGFGAGLEVSNTTGGSVTIGGGPIQLSGDNDGFLFDNVAGPITIDSDVTGTGAYTWFDFNQLAASVTFNGAVSLAPAANPGIQAFNVTAGTLGFYGGLNVESGNGDAFHVNGSGTGRLEVTGAGNTLVGYGGGFLNAGLQFGPAGVTFESISADGAGFASSGIVLSGVGSLGAFTVTGDGSTPESGGVIQNFLDEGVLIQSTGAASLAFMSSQGNGGDGFLFNGPGTFTLDNVRSISNGAFSQTAVHGVNLSAVTGTVTIDNAVIEAPGGPGSGSVGINVSAGNGVATALNVSNTTVTGYASGPAIYGSTAGTGTIDASLTDNVLGTALSGLGRGVNLFIDGTGSSELTLSGGTIRNVDEAVRLTTGSSASLAVDVNGTRIGDYLVSAVDVLHNSTGTADVTVRNAFVGEAADGGYGVGSDGIVIGNILGGVANVLIDNSVVSASASGVAYDSDTGAHSVVLTDNTVVTDNANGIDVLFTESGSMCFGARNNAVSSGGDFGLAVTQSSTVAQAMSVEGLILGPGQTATAFNTYLDGNNSLFPSAGANDFSSPTPFGFTGVAEGTCTVPTLPVG